MTRALSKLAMHCHYVTKWVTSVMALRSTLDQGRQHSNEALMENQSLPLGL
jgi:hypothetical protein